MVETAEQGARKSMAAPQLGALARQTVSADPEVSSRRAADQIAWLRDYAPRRINSLLIDERRCIPPYIVQDFGRTGLFGPLIEEEYGGTALLFRDMFRVFEQLMAIDTALGTWMTTSLFPGTRALSVWATREIKQEWLPLLASGRTLGAYAQTEPGAGSDFSQLSTTARPASAGGWLLSGDKHWIGNGAWAGISTVIARLEAQRTGPSSLVALAVPTASRGVRLGEEHLSFGQRGMVQNKMHFTDVVVPDSHVLADGNGRLAAMDSMCASRLALAAFALGALKRIAQLAFRFARRRTTSGVPLMNRAVIRGWLADTVTRTDILEALVYDLADRLDTGQTVSIESAIAAKVLGSEWAVEAADRLMQLLGGRGYDEANVAARMYRDLRVYRIFEGPTEALCDFLARRALRQSGQVRTMLSTYSGTDLARRFEAAVAARPTGDGLPDAPHAAVADALMWTLAAGAVRRHSPHHTHAQRAAEAQLQRALDGVCARGAGPTTASQDLLEGAADRYTQHIGDVVQQLPGAHCGLDPLLQPTRASGRASRSATRP
ncbi:acyl-CoA dehydrogenase family protein [Streptomyces sp. AK02-04a]|uniref:acyl-CoA dehydrogenase family protein n=1 Tax=Streptomyces sp. AK02-04a TaxID=3028649 RepID=UPI0029AF804A|nr:acyl-CoA dehydrogenase family protein [Streptomyces sp. AK02-04a]MDX3763694.1 acyl-CoA dehydrogenase family protein [Streptomyces sp. AK02-04a]